MPAEDVSDLKDVFDAINRLCETMKTSYSDDRHECTDLASPTEVYLAVAWSDALGDGSGQASQFVSAEDLSVQRMETQRQKWMDSQASLTGEPSSSKDQLDEPWSDCQASPPGPAEDAETVTSDTEPIAAPCSDLYYTASSEVSLTDSEHPEKQTEGLDKEDKECVIAGHVAAMRERFESMTRANTPCPDTVRSSPSLDLCRNITPSPDLLG